jgi:hypothetical protein
MAILAALQSASTRLLGQKLTTFFGSTDTFQIELCDLVNEAAQDIAKYRDWQALVSSATIASDGSTAAFPLPADYDRMMLNAGVQNSAAPFWGYQRFIDLNEFAAIADFPIMPGAWAIYGNALHFSPAPSQTATYPYIVNTWAASSSGTRKAAFDNDSDSFLLPERLLTLWLVWRWRENKKQDSTGDMEAFALALDQYAAKDGGSRIQRYGGRTVFSRTRVAYSGIAS